MTSQVLAIFKKISLPCGNDEKVKEKEKEIIKILEGKYSNIHFDLKQGIIIPAEEEEKVVIVSHYDLIPSFNKGFKNKREPFSLDKDGIIQGALDNTITNAVLIWLLLNIDKPKNVEILFSNMEEIGCIGMRNYINKIPKEIDRNNKMFFINLDVTNDNWKYSTSVEMDKPIYEVIHFLKDKFEGIVTSP